MRLLMARTLTPFSKVPYYVSLTCSTEAEKLEQSGHSFKGIAYTIESKRFVTQPPYRELSVKVEQEIVPSKPTVF